CHAALHPFPTRRSSDLEAKGQVDVYIRVRTDGALQLPVTLWDTKRFFEQDQYAFAWQLVFAGIMLALALYNLLLLFAVRDVSYRSEEHTSELQSRENLV